MAPRGRRPRTPSPLNPVSDHVRTEEGLRAAVVSHRTIGQAVGVLIERHRLTDGAAFDRLRDASSRRNVKLRDLAERLIRTGGEP